MTATTALSFLTVYPTPGSLGPSSFPSGTSPISGGTSARNLFFPLLQGYSLRSRHQSRHPRCIHLDLDQFRLGFAEGLAKVHFLAFGCDCNAWIASLPLCNSHS